MAYKKPNLYSVNKQQMLNNVTAASCTTDYMSLPSCGVTSCTTNSTQEQTCGSTSTGTCGILGVSPCNSNATGMGCNSTHSTPSCETTSNDTCKAQASYLSSALTKIEGDTELISIDLDPYTNEIHITAGSLYPVEQLAELCRELYT